MRMPVLLVLVAFILSGCSLFVPKPVYPTVDPGARDLVIEKENLKSSEVTTIIVEVERYVVDDSKPASFEDYKKWRRDNDPGGQTYAEFKEWEAAFGEWQLQQKQALK
jgi:hypothetical protein